MRIFERREFFRCAFLVFEKGDVQKIALKIFRFVSMGFNMIINVIITARKTIFLRSWNITESSKRPRKYHLSINFLTEKGPYFPSPKSSKQELLSNQ